MQGTSHSLGWLLSRKTECNKCCWACGEAGTLCTVAGIVKWCNGYGKQYGGSSKIKNKSSIWTALPFLGIYPKELKTEAQRDICTPMFITAVFTVAKRWKQPRYPLMDKWVSKMWYIHTKEYYTALKWKEILSHVKTWMNLEDIMLNEVNQLQKSNTAWFHLYEVFKVVKFIEIESREMALRGWGRGKGSCYLMGIEVQLQDENIVVSRQCKYT